MATRYDLLIHHYKGKMIKDVYDALEQDARSQGWRSVNIAFPDGIDNIDEDLRRLNVRVDSSHRIVGFFTG